MNVEEGKTEEKRKGYVKDDMCMKEANANITMDKLKKTYWTDIQKKVHDQRYVSCII